MNLTEQESFQSLLTQAVIKLCQREAVYCDELRIEGTICVTSDRTSVMIAHITHCIGDVQSTFVERNGVCDSFQFQHASAANRLLLGEVKSEHTSPLVHALTDVVEGFSNDTANAIVFSSAEQLFTADTTGEHKASMPQFTDGRFQCPYCSKSYSSKQTLRHHKRSLHGHQQQICQFCPAAFSSIAALNSHMKQCHHDCMAVDVQWELDAKKESEIWPEKQHYHLPTDDIPTISCVENIKLSPSQHTEGITTSNTERYDNIESNSESLLHILEQRNYENVTADQEMSLRSATKNDPMPKLVKNEYTKPVTLHSGNSNPSCDTETIMKYFEKVRLQTEDGLYRYKCLFCSKMFKLRTSVYEHISSHTGSRPYACSHCGDRFVYRSSLHNHVRNKHSTASNAERLAAMRYQCEKCDRRFRFRSEFQRHLRTNPDHSSNVS